eukprot:5130298-Amphidinium_carterae.3
MRLSGLWGGGGSGGGRRDEGEPSVSTTGTRLAGMRKGTRMRPIGLRTAPIDDWARRRRSRSFSVVMASERLPSAIRCSRALSSSMTDVPCLWIHWSSASMGCIRSALVHRGCPVMQGEVPNLRMQLLSGAVLPDVLPQESLVETSCGA